MNYSKANKNQIEEVFSVFSAAIENMKKQGIHQWDEIYPDKAILEEESDEYQRIVAKNKGKLGHNAVQKAKKVPGTSEKLLTDIFPDYKPPKQDVKKPTKKATQSAKTIDYSLPLD